jgi:hypothetical protein
MPETRHETPPAAVFGRPILQHYSVLLWSLVLGLFIYRVSVLSFQHAFDTDEFEHVQGAWLISQGLVIYRDFFEHHPPLFYFLLSPLLAFFDEPGKLLVARGAMIPFALGIMGMTFLIAAKIRGKLAGVIACVLLSTVVVFQQKSIEIRPDVPGILFLLLAFYWSCTSRPGLLRLASVGAACGLALLCTPKLVFALPAFAVLLISPGETPILNWRAGGWMILGFLLPVGLVAAYLHLHDALRAAVFFNSDFNLAVPYTYRWSSLRQTFGQSFADNWAFWLFSFFAIAMSMLRTIRKFRMSDAHRRGEWLITGAATGLGIGFLLIQVPLRQYLMFLCVVLAILSGICGARVIRRMMKSCRSTAARVLILGLLTGLLLHPLPGLLRERLHTNQQQFLTLRYVWGIVPVNESVFDCWTGIGVFRRPAFFYHFLGLDIIGALERLDPKILQDSLIQSLKDKRPLAIVIDPMLNLLPINVSDYINANYHVDNPGVLLMRNRSTSDRAESP